MRRLRVEAVRGLYGCIHAWRLALPERIALECEREPDAVPVVLLHLVNGSTMDLCHIPHVAASWLAAFYHRDATRCADMDLALLLYELVAYVTVSLSNRADRRMGFRSTPSPAEDEGAFEGGAAGRRLVERRP